MHRRIHAPPLPCRSLLLALLAAGTARAQLGYQPAPGLESVDFTSPTHSSESHQRCALYLPAGPAPVSGYPVVIRVVNGSLTTTDDCYFDGIVDTPLHQLVDAGFAVVRASLTVSGRHNDWTCAKQPPVLGKGLFHPPGASLAGFASPPYSSPDRPSAEKDLVMLIQHVRHNAATLGLDGSRIAMIGPSGGATVGMWCALGPERGPELFGPGASGQDLESSRVDAAILRNGIAYFPALQQDTIEGVHFPDAAKGHPWEDSAPTLAQAFPSYLTAASSLVYQDAALNAQQRFYLIYTNPTTSLDFEPATPGGLDYLQDALPTGHSAWFGHVWKTLYPQTRLVLAYPWAVVPGAPYDAMIDDKGLLALDLIDYLQQELAIPSRVSVAGPGTAGTSGTGFPLTPVLTGNGGFGQLAGGRLVLSLVEANSALVLVQGSALLGLPVFGGTLGPLPELLVGDLTADANGSYSFDLPAGYVPAGRSLYFQFWSLDSSGPQGWTASNTLEVLAPGGP